MQSTEPIYGLTPNTARRQGKKAQDFFYNLFTLQTAQAQASLYRNPLPNKEHGEVLQC